MNHQTIQVAQLTILILVGLLFYRGFRDFKIRPFRGVFVGWCFMTIALLCDLFLTNFPFENSFFVGFINEPKVIVANIYLIFDTIGAYFVLKSCSRFLPELLKAFIPKNRTTLSIGYLTLIGLTIVTVVFPSLAQSLKLVIGVFYSSILFVSLFSLFYFFRALCKEHKAGKLLPYVTLLYAVLQFSGIFLLVGINSKTHELILVVIFTIGLISKAGILYGLLSLFIRSDVRGEQELTQDGQDKLLGKTFHDIYLATDSIETSIHLILTKYSYHLEKNTKVLIEYVDNMNRIIQNTMAASKLDFKEIDVECTDRVNMEPQPTNLNTLVQLTLMVLTEKDKNHLTILPKYGGKANILGYPSDILRMLRNFIRNSNEALKDFKDGVLLIKTSKKEKEDGLDYVSLIIEDNGPGISDDIVDRIWESGFTTKDDLSVSNRGFGLAICKDIISFHKAEITLENKINSDKSERNGTRFTIVFPHVNQKIKLNDDRDRR